jgi:hypothetical protein
MMQVDFLFEDFVPIIFWHSYGRAGMSASPMKKLVPCRAGEEISDDRHA